MAPRRMIDSFPQPVKKTPMKFVCISASRTGTLGLYQAFTILGYRPYHMVQCVGIYGVDHMTVFNEALTAENNKLSGIKRLDRADFDRWMAPGEHDVFVELGCFFPESTLAAYLPDPDVRFLLTERDPHRWALSVDKFVGGIVKELSKPHMAVLKYFSSKMYHFLQLNINCYACLSDGSTPYDEDRMEKLRDHYIAYIRRIKEAVPPERLTVVKLEDGLGWPQVCAFTGDPEPDVSYPKGTEHDEKVQKMLFFMMTKALVNAATVFVVPAVAVGYWWFRSS